MRIRPILVSAVVSAGAALVLVVSEVASMGGIPKFGGNANPSLPWLQKPSHSHRVEPDTSPWYGFDQTAPGGDMQTYDPSSAQAPSNSGGDQSTVVGTVQQTLSNGAPPISLGPIGH